MAEYSVSELEKIRETCALPFHMLSAYTDFTHPDKEVRMASVKAAQEKIRKTHALGGRFIRLPGGAAHPEAVSDVKTALDHMYECFEACIPAAEECQVRIVFENDSKPPSWETPNFAFDLERFVKTWDRLKELPIGFNYDTGNAFFLDDWKLILETVLDRLETLHITDYYFKNGDLKMIVFGEGNVPVKEMLSIIKESGFDGRISMEDTTFQGLEGTAKSYQYVRRVCDEVFGK